MKTIVTFLSEVKARIKAHEGCSLVPYECTEGFQTVGYGRNITDVPFSDDEVELMFQNDFEKALKGAVSFPWYSKLDETRAGVIIEMCFQLGVFGVARFKKMAEAIMREDWECAADEMLDSKWHKQTPARCRRLADLMRKGDE
jgi:lysozyme